MVDEIDLRERCARCGHSYSFHSKRFEATCKAMGCKGGPDGTRCPGFVLTEPEQSQPLSATV